MIALVVAGISFDSNDPFWITYTDPILLEFVAGLLIARYREVLALPRLVPLLPLGILAIACSGLVEGPRVILWGIPAAAIVLGALAWENSGKMPINRALLKLGDASYSIYLLQLIALTVATLIVKRLPIGGPLQFAALICLTIAGAIVLGLIAYRWIETPIVAALKRNTARRTPETVDRT